MCACACAPDPAWVACIGAAAGMGTILETLGGCQLHGSEERVGMALLRDDFVNRMQTPSAIGRWVFMQTAVAIRKRRVPVPGQVD